MSIFIPDDTPFNANQKKWLEGFLAGLGLLSQGATAATADAPAQRGEPLAILWGSQTGTAESFAKKLAKKASAAGFTPTILDMSAVEPEALASFGNVAILTSTYGDGEPPDNAAALHSALMAQNDAIFSGVKFSVFALGDSNYPAFCQCGRDFDQKLEALGATRIAPRVEGDCDYDAPFAAWSTSLIDALVEVPVAA